METYPGYAHGRRPRYVSMSGYEWKGGCWAGWVRGFWWSMTNRGSGARWSGGCVPRGWPLPPARDELRALAEALNDLLARRDAATQRLQQFTGHAAHELRSPVAAIRAQAEVAVTHPDPDLAEATWEDIAAEAQRLSALLDDLPWRAAKRYQDDGPRGRSRLHRHTGQVPADAGQAALTVVAAALVRDGRVLAQRRAFPPEAAGRWELPGGRVEAGESAAKALIRECREELAVDVVPGAQLGLDVPLPGGATLRVHIAWLVDPAATPRPVEHAELRWVSPEELVELDWLDADRAVLPDLAALLKAQDNGHPGGAG